MRVRGVPVCVVLGFFAYAVSAQQGFYREFYAGIAGGSVANLTNAPAFPNSPSVEEVVNGVLETGTNIGDLYGHRVRALVTAPVTGSYTFWIASDDNGELWLGTNALSVTRRRIAYVPSYSGPRVWTSSVYQCSSAITLTAGSRYYIEALQKENTGGDNLAVAWLVPGSGVTSVIPAEAMQPYLEAPAIRTQPVSVEIFEQWAGTRDVTFSVEAVRKAGLSYQWQVDGADIPGATQPAYTCRADAANSNRLFRCSLSSLSGAVTSQTARYTFVPDRVSPAVTALIFSHDRRMLTLTFSEPLLEASVSNGAFTVSGATVTEAALLTGGSNVVVRLAGPLAAGSSNELALAVEDCATPANRLALAGQVITPPQLAAPPVALVRGEVEPPGPSSRRSPFALTEISHTPAARADGLDLRFVEIYNSNPYAQDISGYRFSGAFDYTVPSGTVMPASGYLVIAPAPGDIASAYAITNVIGGFDAVAFDGTSEITLNDELGAWLTTVAYSDDPPWPVAADGSGHTLVLARPSYGEREADGWAASARPGGSPGAAEPLRPSAYEAVLLNEVLAHAGATPGFVEIHNVSTAALSLAGCVIRHGPPLSDGFTVPDGAVLPAGGFLAYSEAELGFKIDGTGDTLWLSAPAGAGGEVVDAIRFGDQELGVAFGRYPDGAAAWNRLEAPTPAFENAARRASEVVLSEIMYHPISESKDEEYVELFNPGTNDVDLTGWKLGGGIAYTFSETIPANGFLLVPRDRATLAQLYPGQAALMTGSYDGSLNNTRDTVTLSRPVTVMDTADPLNPVAVRKNAVVESVTYRDGGEWCKLADGGGSSLERVDPRADPRLARSWAASDETQKSGWTTVSFTGVIDNGFTVSTNGDPNAVNVGLMDGGECLVDSVEAKVAGGENLVSNPSFEAGTNGWRFMGTHDQSSVETDAAAPDGSSVLHLRASDRCHNGMNIVRGLMSATLAKSGTGTISVRARWLSGCPELLVRTRGSWIEACGNILTTRALGTPGQRNSRARDNGAPAVFDVIHQPVLPRNGEKVTVYARAQDPDGVSACTLSYRVEGLAVTNVVAMAPVAAGYFAGEIPAGQSNNVIVAFTVEAADGRAQTACSRFPGGAPARECLVRYNEPLNSRAFGSYRFWVTKENIAYWAARDKASNQPVDATFLYGTNRVIYSAGMQYSGSPFHSGYTAPINPGASIDYEANFQSDDTLLDDDGVVLSTIGNLGSDTNGIREQFCYSLAHAVKIPHMYRRYVHVYANGAEQNPKKIYEDTEKPNAGVLKHWFPEDSDNDFFKVDDWFEYNLGITGFDILTARLQKYATTNAQSEVALKLGRYRWNWLKRGYETFRANDYTNFFSLVEALNNADTNTYLQRLQEEVNLAEFVPVIAVNEFIGNFDSYGFSRGKNMYLYDSADGWQLIAWDLDYNFQMSRPLNDPINPALPSFPTEDPTMRAFLKTPAVTRIFWRAVEKISAAANDPALLALTRAKYEALKADSAVLTGTFDNFISLVEIRRTNVVAQLAAANPTNLTVASPAADVSSATQNVMTVSGTAPFSVTTLRVNGVDVPITWASPSNWTVQVVLNSGTNAFTVQAFTENGSLLPGGSVTRSVVYAGEPLDAMTDFLGFSEIMNAPPTNGAAYVELANRSATTLMNLSGYYLAGAVSFTFPNGTVMKPGDRLCVAENRAAFSAAYGSNLASRVAGTYSGSLPAAGTLLLKRPAAGFEPDDAVIDRVVYEASAPWPEAVPAGTSLRLINPAIDNNRVANWSAEGTSLALFTNAVPWNMVWKHFPTNYPGDGWNGAGFNDSGWTNGPGVLAYETSTTLPIPVGTTLTLRNGRLAYYFRTTFVATNDPVRSVLKLTYMLDDGAVFYLNGQEICRSSLMPTGAVTDATAAVTAKTPEGQIEGPFTLPATALLKGTNTLAVSVHQNQSASSDLVFGMSLDIITTFTNACSPGVVNALNTTLTSLPAVWLNELQLLNVTGPADGVGEREPWVELYNAETGTVSLAGWSLAAAPDDSGWAFPSNAAVAAGGFLRVWLDGEPAESDTNGLHAGFGFGATNGLLLLRAPVDGRTVTADYLRLARASDDAVWGAYPDGASNPRRWLSPATPCASNRIDRPAVRVVLNEFMAQNDLFANPLNGKKDDWFELFNDGSQTADLGGYVITDTLVSEDPPAPDLRASKALVISNGVSLLPGQALRLWTGASKPYLLPFDPANLQAPFGLSKDGDQICLFNPALQLVDRIVFTNGQSGAASMGRWVNGAAGDWVTLARPTPGEPNRNPRYGEAVLAQPPALALRETEPFGYTNGFAAVRPAGFTFRLYPAEGAVVPTNLSFDAGSGVLAWTPDESQGPGVYPLRVCGFTVDGLSVTACDETLLTLSVLETLNRPVLCALPLVTVNEGGVAAFTASFTRAEEIPARPTSTRLRMAQAIPSTATFEAGTGAFRWETAEIDGPSTNVFTVVAEDASDASVCDAAVVTVKVSEVNSPLTYLSPTNFYLWRNEPFEVTLRSADADLPPNRITYHLISGPAGMTLDTDTGLLQWQPGSAQTGTFSFRVVVSDHAGSTASKPGTIRVDTACLQAAAFAHASQAGAIDMRWDSKPDTFYTVEWCPDLGAGEWRAVNADAPVAGTGSAVSLSFAPSVIGSPTSAFFRVRQTR